jgi:glycosyltransferase involved in cell wall biosynthesis
MKLCGVTMLRNEADIVESFVRHNLTFLDSLFVVDHGSSDGTPEILAALAAEGLPLEVDRDPSVGYLQSEIMTRAARHAFARHGADFVFAIDGDEFLKVPRRELLESVLATLPHGLHGAMRWQTYVPDFDDAALTSRNVLAGAKRRLAAERHGLHKVIVARSFADMPDAVIAVGNHVVLPHAAHVIAEQPVKQAKISADVVALGHLPVRSARQLTNKIVIGWLAHCVARRSNADLAFHWRELYQEMAGGREPGALRLHAIAANYGLPMAAWMPPGEIALIEDPLPVGELRYSAMIRDATLPLVLRFAETLAAG